MLADTDAGCLITAAQSGAQFGYALILPQLLLIPILFMTQEITVRLGIVTKKGHGALIREHFGRVWAWISGSTLFLSAIGALLTEFIGVAGVGELFGVPKALSVTVATAFLVGLALTGSYTKVERIGIAVGLAELAFIPAMIFTHPDVGEIARSLGTMPVHDSAYLYLLAANVGAVVMPWMIFYQQGAVVDKGLRPIHLKQARRDTAIGSVLTQGIMIVVIVAYGTTAFKSGNGGEPLNTVGDLTAALAPFIGSATAKVTVGAAILGGALVAALVVSLAGSWGLAEVVGWKHSLNERIGRKNWKFYTVYILIHVLGAVLVFVNVDLVHIAVDVEVMNALLLPLVLGMLLLLEAKALPPEYRMRGIYRWATTGVCIVVMGFGLYMVPQALV
jgi:Mn2+/Fe2+ NRAMP family transporter